MSIQESDVRKIIAEVQAISWCLRECIRGHELAATHRLGQMRRLRMLEEQKAWMREAGFDKIEITAEMVEQRSRIGSDSQPFYTKLYNPRWPHTPEEYTLEMRVDVERLKTEILRLQPTPPPQRDSSPRPLPAADTGSEELGTPQRLPAIGTGSDELGVSRADSRSTEREGFFLFKPVRIDFCTSAQAWTRRVPLLCFNQTSG